MNTIKRILIGILVTNFCLMAAGANAIWINAEDQGNGWKYLEWFGHFQEPAPDWIYHSEHGFMRVHGSSTDDFSLYDMALGSWFRVSDASYPFVYKLGYMEGWYWYYPGSGPEERIFRNVTNGSDVGVLSLVEYIEPTYALISAGAFEMGDGLDATYLDGLERLPVHTVNLTAYHMQHTSVTNAQFARVFNWALSQGLLRFEGEQVYNTEGDSQPLLHTNFWGQVKWDGSAFYVVSGKDSYPCVGPSWYGAMAYCNYLTRMEGTFTQSVDLTDWSMDLSANGYRLPTEAEWENPGRGGLVNHRFPWEDWWITHEDANYYATNIRLSSHDLVGIQRKALKKGVPYQALISGLIHQYVEGDLVEKTM